MVKAEIYSKFFSADFLRKVTDLKDQSMCKERIFFNAIILIIFSLPEIF